MIHSGTYLLHFIYVYLHMWKNNKPVRSENLTSGQIFFKEDLIWLVRGTPIVKNCSVIAYTQYKRGRQHMTPFFRPHHKWRHNSPLFLLTTPFFLRALLLCFQMCYLMPVNTFFKFKQRHAFQYGLIEFLMHFV